MSKEMYLIRGLPGSGKTTLAERLAGHLQAIHLEADKYFMRGGEYVFDAAKLHRAHAWCQNRCEEIMRDGCPVIISNTFTTVKEMKPYLALADVFEYSVTSLIVENRHGNISVHGVPTETMDKMRRRFAVEL